LSAIVSVFYPLWYRSYRFKIKEIINTDINAAKSLLDSTITEHDTIANNDPVENNQLRHAQRHIIHAEQDTVQKDRTIRALQE
jgi:hypothetical protein